MEAGWIATRRRPVKVDKVVGWYDVWTGDLPFAQLTLKVTQSCDSSGYLAIPNLFVVSPAGIEYTVGAGDTIERAVANAIEVFYDEIEKYHTLDTVTEDDFVWLQWTPFGSEPYQRSRNNPGDKTQT